MNILYAIGLSLLVTTVTGWFIILTNAYFLKERKILQMGNRADSDDLDEARRYHRLWHRSKGALYVAISVSLAIYTYLLTNATLSSLLVVPAVLSVLWSFGDMFLNFKMEWNLFTRGDKSGMDIVPFWVRFAILACTIVAILLTV